MNKKRHRYFYLQWTKREREDIDTFTYNGQRRREKTYILLLTMDKMNKKGHRYFYLQGTKREREDIDTFTYNGQRRKEKT